MALLTHQVFITIQDDKGLQSTMIVHIPAATLAVDAVDFAGLLVNEVAPLTTGGIVAAGVSLAADIVGHGTIDPLSDVQEKGEFTYRTVNNFPAKVSLSTLDEQFVLGASQTLDIGDPLVAAFNSAMLVGIVVPSTAVVVPTDGRGEDLTSLQSALERFRRRSRVD